MKKIILIMLFFINNCLSQYKTIDKTDTIFIEYYGTKNEAKEIKLNKNGEKINVYRLNKFNLLFIQQDSPYKYIYKKNIKKNKILNYKFFNGIKNTDTLRTLIKKLKEKKVYIVDYTEKNKDQIPIYLITPFYTAYKPALE